MNAANRSRIIVALDYASAEAARPLVAKLEPRRCRLKVGKELFVSAGPAFVSELVGNGFDVFLDLKFHDIPNTVARACSAAADLGVWMLNVHASGGSRMIAAAREALDKRSGPRPLLIAVTVLTSMGEDDLRELGLVEGAAATVERLATLSRRAGADGVVCSAREAAALRAAQGRDFVLVTPGIRPEWSATGDQTRITTPAEALRLGSDYLVIGRPITAAPDPMAALERIEAELASALD